MALAIISELEKSPNSDISEKMADCANKEGSDALMVMLGGVIRFACPYIKLERPEYVTQSQLEAHCPLARSQFSPMSDGQGSWFYRPSCGSHKTIGPKRE